MPKKSLGTKVKIGANAIAELTSIGGLEISADTIETTNYDSLAREYIQGMIDAGEVPLEGTFNPGDTNGQKALYDLLLSGAVTAFSILFPAAMGAEWDFNGVVTKFSTSEDLEDAIKFSATIKVSGLPSLGLTASGGLTALSLSGTGGALTPAFANTTYSYAFSGVTATSVTVTATAASHTLKLFIDGVYSQDLTSGSASAAIAMATVGSKKLTILAFESGKTTKVYEVVVVKTA